MRQWQGRHDKASARTTPPRRGLRAGGAEETGASSRWGGGDGGFEQVGRRRRGLRACRTEETGAEQDYAEQDYAEQDYAEQDYVEQDYAEQDYALLSSSQLHPGTQCPQPLPLTFFSLAASP
jgi:hypothetical protein